MNQRISRMYEQANYQTFNYNNNDALLSGPSKTVDLYGSARAAFIQKVYMVLTAQILITVMFVILSVNSAAFFLFQLQNVFLFYICLLITVVIQIYMFCCQGGRTSPASYVCLGLFTFSEAYIVSFISSATGKESGNSVVLLAGMYTLAIVIALTIYACKTTSDFTTSYGLVLVMLVCLLILFVTSMFVSSPFLTNLYCCVGVFLFGLYLIIDTQMIVGGKSVELTIDEYAIAAMLLYIDIIQMFLYILRWLSNKE